jgi:hypothetical protein
MSKSAPRMNEEVLAGLPLATQVARSVKVSQDEFNRGT